MLGFLHIPEICFHPPNVLHEFRDRSEKVPFFTHPKSMFPFPSQKMFSTHFGIEVKMLGLIHIQDIYFQSSNFWHAYHDKFENVGVYKNPWNTFPLPKYQDKIENVWFYTHPRNMFSPPKCLALISGSNWECKVLYTYQIYVSTPQMFGTNFRIELRMLGFIHIPEIYFHPWNVRHMFQDRNENVWFYTYSQNWFLPH